MAKKGKHKGVGRGRFGVVPRNALGHFVETTTPSSTSTLPEPTVSATTAIPVGPTTTPETIQKEMSGFRKALLQTMKELGAEESKIQDAVLDGLRETAEKIVAENNDIFGRREQKTIEQSAAYELFEEIVRLGESAAKAKTINEKKKILQRLRTYKSVVSKVFTGGDGKKSVIAQKLLQMIETIEKPLSKESGKRAAIKEGIQDYLKTVPERMAKRIPLIGGILSGIFQRRREQKEEEKEALTSITEEISKAGRSNLYRTGNINTKNISSVPLPDITPPVSTLTPISSIGRGAFNKSSTKILQDILIQVKDIKNLLFNNFDPKKQKLREEELKREAADEKYDMLNALKSGNFFGSKSGDTKNKGEGGDWLNSILKTLGVVAGGGAVSGTLPWWKRIMPWNWRGTPTPPGSNPTTPPGGGRPPSTSRLPRPSGLMRTLGFWGAVLAPLIITSSAGESEEEIKTMITGQKRMQELQDAGMTYEEAFYYSAMEDHKYTVEQLRKKGVPEERLPPPPEFSPDFMKKLEQTKKLKERFPEAYPEIPVPDREEFEKKRLEELFLPSYTPSTAESSFNSLEQYRTELTEEEIKNRKYDMFGAIPTVNSVVAPNTTNNISVNNNDSNGTRNNDPTLKAAERATF